VAEAQAVRTEESQVQLTANTQTDHVVPSVADPVGPGPFWSDPDPVRLEHIFPFIVLKSFRNA
jgi:hypothetical protein